MSRTVERTESQAMREVREARARLHDKTKDLTFEQRQAFFANERKRFDEIARTLKNEEQSEGMGK